MNRAERRRRRKQAGGQARQPAQRPQGLGQPERDAALLQAYRLRQAGQGDKASDMLHAILEAEPDQSDALHLLGLLAGDRQDLETAEALLRRAIDREPNYAEALGNLANILQVRDKVEEAVSCYRRALVLRPDIADIHNNLGNALKLLERSGEAIPCYEAAIARAPTNPTFHGNLAVVAFQDGDMERAKVAYENALALARHLGPSERAKLHNGLGSTLMALGRADAALSAFRDAVTSDASFAEAYRHIAYIKRFETADDPEFKAMRTLHATPELDADRRKELAFGLGKACEDLGDHAAAFAYFSEGNHLKKLTISGDPAEPRRLLEAARVNFDAAFFARHAGLGNADETPVLILGPPRSGTTLVEQILASHRDVGAAGEIEVLAPAIRAHLNGGPHEKVGDTTFTGLEEAATDYVAALRGACGDHPRITDKNLVNAHLLGFVAVMLPRARIIQCQRHRADTCLSIFRQNFSSSAHSYAFDLEHTIAFVEAYEALMEHYREVLPGRIHHIRYEELVADPEPRIRSLLDFCGLAWDPACLTPERTDRAVLTSSNVQVRRPINRGGLDQWRRYESQLAPYRDRLGI